MSLRSRSLAVWLLFCIAPIAAIAQTPGERDLIQERQQRLLEEQQRRLDDLRQLPGKAPQSVVEPAVQEERCFDIQRIELSGASQLGPADRASILAPFVGQCLGVGQLNQLLKVITDHYVGRGYVTTRHSRLSAAAGSGQRHPASDSGRGLAGGPG